MTSLACLKCLKSYHTPRGFPRQAAAGRRVLRLCSYYSGKQFLSDAPFSNFVIFLARVWGPVRPLTLCIVSTHHYWRDSEEPRGHLPSQWLRIHVKSSWFSIWIHGSKWSCTATCLMMYVFKLYLKQSCRLYINYGWQSYLYLYSQSSWYVNAFGWCYINQCCCHCHWPPLQDIETRCSYDRKFPSLSMLELIKWGYLATYAEIPCWNC